MLLLLYVPALSPIFVLSLNLMDLIRNLLLSYPLNEQVMWSTNEWPIDNTTPEDGAKKPIFSGKSHNDNGSVVRFVDIPPGASSPMHRTRTLDYGIVIFGEIELELDSGEKRTLKPGDTCIQRGTNHLWRNNTDKWGRIAFILLHSKEIVINGESLKEHGFPGEQ